MVRTPTTQILAAIEAVRELKDVVAKQTEAIEKLASRIEQIEARLNAAEGEPDGTAP